MYIEGQAFGKKWLKKTIGDCYIVVSDIPVDYVWLYSGPQRLLYPNKDVI